MAGEIAWLYGFAQILQQLPFWLEQPFIGQDTIAILLKRVSKFRVPFVTETLLLVILEGVILNLSNLK